MNCLKDLHYFRSIDFPADWRLVWSINYLKKCPYIFLKFLMQSEIYEKFYYIGCEI